MNRKERRAATKRSQAGGAPLGRRADAAQLFAEAVRQHQLGRAFDAEALCRAVLARDAAHAGSLHLLGVIAMQRGLFEEAVAISRKAAEIRPDIAIGHHSLGKALAAAGRPDAAAAAFERALALQPDFAEAHKDLGVMLMALGALQGGVGKLCPGACSLCRSSPRTSPIRLRRCCRSIPRSAKAWRAPRPPGRSSSPVDELLGAPGLAAIADDAMLLAVLKGTTGSRCGAGAVLDRRCGPRCSSSAAASPPTRTMRRWSFCCALARQCFNNEYVFAESPDETDLRRAAAQPAGRGAGAGHGHPAAASCRGGELSPAVVAARCATAAGTRLGPRRCDELLTQQIREVERGASACARPCRG